MNREDRRRKRQQDTKNAAIAFSAFIIVIIMLITGMAVTVHQVLRNSPKENSPVADSTEQTETEDASGSAEILADNSETAEIPVVDPLLEQAIQVVSGMTLEEKTAQLFMITPDALTGFDGVNIAGETSKNAYSEFPVGGLIYMSKNLQDTDQTKDMLSKMNAIAQERTGLPLLLGVDEEGGSVARIASNSTFNVTNVGDMSAIGATGDSQNAYQAGVTIGSYLKNLGFNVDFAPVADVLTNPENSLIGNRSFGSDSQLVADMVTSELQGLSEQGIYGAVKHFPGHGGTSGDSHDGAVTLEKTLEEMAQTELVPFQHAIDSGASMILVAHISLPNVTGDNTPASLSSRIVTDLLRSQMGFEGVIVTDALNMGAITSSYTADQAAVAAVNAGADILLMPQDFKTAYQGLLDAVNGGTVSEERINESAARIVRLKLKMQQS